MSAVSADGVGLACNEALARGDPEGWLAVIVFSVPGVGVNDQTNALCAVRLDEAPCGGFSYKTVSTVRALAAMSRTASVSLLSAMPVAFRYRA